MSNDPAVCVAEELSVGYRVGGSTHSVLTGLNLSLRAGELTCLIGPNGTGKSTLMRTIAGMQPALSGRVLLGGHDVAAIERRQRARLLGVVLTDRVTVPALGVREVVELGRYPHRRWDGVDSAADRLAVAEALAAVGATELADRGIAELSDGERQRVMIARALAQEPSVLLLDEPTAFLDVARKADMFGLLRNLAHQLGRAVLCSVHELDLALRTADQVWLIYPDHTIGSSLPEDLLRSDALERCFQARGSFDRDRGTFAESMQPVGIARVAGTGLEAELTTRLLTRLGYQVKLSPAELTAAESGLAGEVVVKVGSRFDRLPSAHWEVRFPSQPETETLDSLSALSARLREELVR